jgi:hypothetical protein
LKKRDCDDCKLDVDIAKLRQYFDIALVSEHVDQDLQKEHKFYQFDICNAS